MHNTFGLTRVMRARVAAGPKRPAMAMNILTFAAAQKNDVTADECMYGLGLTHQSSSARFHELAKSGCLRKTQLKRETRSGGMAIVYIVEPNASFRMYLDFIQRGDTHGAVKDRALMSAMLFIRGWSRAKSKATKRRLITTLVTRLVDLSGEWMVQ